MDTANILDLFVASDTVTLCEQNILEKYSLKVVEIPGDGLCFVSSIRLFFKQILQTDISVQNVIERCRLFFTEQPIEVDTNMYSSYEEFLSSCLDSYFGNRIYNQGFLTTQDSHLKCQNADSIGFVDYVVGASANLFKINILIVNINLEQNHRIVLNLLRPQVNEYPDQLLIVRRTIAIDANNNESSHYDLVVPNHVAMRFRVLAGEENRIISTSTIF